MVELGLRLTNFQIIRLMLVKWLDDLTCDSQFLFAVYHM